MNFSKVNQDISLEARRTGGRRTLRAGCSTKCTGTPAATGMPGPRNPASPCHDSEEILWLQ